MPYIEGTCVCHTSEIEDTVNCMPQQGLSIYKHDLPEPYSGIPTKDYPIFFTAQTYL